MSDKTNLYKEYLMELKKIDEAIGELGDYISDTLDEPFNENDADHFYHDIHTMSLFSDQAIRKLNELIAGK
jgi:hypothetical protein